MGIGRDLRVGRRGRGGGGGGGMGGGGISPTYAFEMAFYVFVTCF